MRPLIPPVQPWRGLRTTDALGSGEFGASRDKSTRVHLGQDYKALKGDAAVSPITGIVQRLGWAYPDADLGLIVIDGTGEFDGASIRLLYVNCFDLAKSRNLVTQGQAIGVVQDVRAYYHKKHPTVPEITNHVHLELIMHVDPRLHMEMPA